MECVNPFLINYQTDDEMPVPCGKCQPCLKRRVSQWSFRLQQEEKTAATSHFITLTYDTEHVPLTESNFPTLCKRDLQLFFKRLRKSHTNGEIIKYYGVGEYGTHRFRPHYHVILFNANRECISNAWSLKGKPIGHVHYGNVEGASIGYCLEYITEGCWRPRHKNDDRKPQFAVMSKGLGISYLTPKMISWHYADLENRMYVNIPDGKKVSMPTYYKNKMYDEQTRKRIGELNREKQIAEEKRAREAKGVERWYQERAALAHKMVSAQHLPKTKSITKQTF